MFAELQGCEWVVPLECLGTSRAAPAAAEMFVGTMLAALGFLPLLQAAGAGRRRSAVVDVHAYG